MNDTAAAGQDLNEFQRVVGVFWEPRPVFENAAARPRWLVPLIILTVLSVLYVSAFSRIVGWEVFIRQQIESSARLQQQLSPEQRERIIEQQTRAASKFGLLGASVGVAASTLLVAVVLLGVFNLLAGTSLKFRQSFSITCYSFLPTGLSTILALVVMFLKDPAEFDLQNPLVLNVGAFLDPNATPKWLLSVASSLDAFTVWVILLLAVGYSTAAKNLSFSKALTLIVSVWAVWLVSKAGWTVLVG